MEAPKGGRVWNILERPEFMGLPAAPPRPEAASQVEEASPDPHGLQVPCLHRHLEKSLIGYTCGHWGRGSLYLVLFFLWGVNGNMRRGKSLFRVHSCFPAPSCK